MSKELTAREINRIYQKEWRAKNKDKVKEYNQRYWLKKAEELQKEQQNAKK